MSKGKLFMFCGKMASGKTTLARKISQQMSSVLISEDDMLEKLYAGEITDVSSYVQRSQRLKAAIRPIIVGLLHSGTSIVLDFPANTIDQRKWLKEVIDESSALYEFHYLDCSNDVCKAQLRERAIKEPERRGTDTPEMFDAISRYFEPPASKEGFQVTIHRCE